MKLYSIFISLCLLLGFFSCEYVIDLEPENKVAYTNFFKTEQDISGVVNMIHVQLRGANTRSMERDVSAWFADKVNEPSSFTRYIQMRELDPAYYVNYTGVSFSWSTYYTGVIYTANLLMDNAYRAEFDKERLEFYLQQAYFAKGLAYFRVAQDYGDAPIINNSQETSPQARKPVKEVLAEAEKWALMAMELPKHEELVNADGAKIVSKQYGSRGSAAALLAHLYAWRAALLGDVKDWESAESYCTKIIEGEVGNYALAATPEDVCVSVLLRDSPEGIWEINIDDVDNKLFVSEPNFLFNGRNVGFPVKEGSTHTDRRIVEVKKQSVLDLYGADKKDRRINAYFFGMDSVQYGEDIFINKWRYAVHEKVTTSPIPVYKGMNANKVIWRLADIILLRAECRARLNDPLAVDDLNWIRERAYGDRSHDYTASEGDLLYTIYKERKKELVYEWQTYYDIVRFGYWKTELPGEFRNLTEEDVQNGALYFPIADQAFNKNDLMTQNVYWLGKKQ